MERGLFICAYMNLRGASRIRGLCIIMTELSHGGWIILKLSLSMEIKPNIPPIVFPPIPPFIFGSLFSPEVSVFPQGQSIPRTHRDFTLPRLTNAHKKAAHCPHLTRLLLLMTEHHTACAIKFPSKWFTGTQRTSGPRTKAAVSYSSLHKRWIPSQPSPQFTWAGTRIWSTDQSSARDALLLQGFSHSLLITSFPFAQICTHAHRRNPSRTWIQHLQECRWPKSRLRIRDWPPRITVCNKNTRGAHHCPLEGPLSCPNSDFRLQT